MTYYWLLLFVILFLCYTGAKSPSRNMFLMVSVLLFFVFFAFRIGFTPDYANYDDIFDQFHYESTTDNINAVEVGFQWLCIILPTYRAVLIVFTAFFCACIYIAFRYYIDSRYWILAFAMLFCYVPFVLGNMSGMRSGIVTCLFFIAILVKSKYKKKGVISAIAIMLLACTFHRSGIALLPLLLIPKHPFNKVIKVVYVIVAVFIFISLFFANSLNHLAVSMTDIVFEDNNFYNYYFRDDVESGFSIFSIIKTIVLAVLLYITLSFTKTEKNETKNLFIKYTAFFYLLVLAPGSIGLITRYYYYFAFPCIIGTYFVLYNAQKTTKMVYITCLSLYAFWQLYDLSRNTVVMFYYMQYNNELFF